MMIGRPTLFGTVQLTSRLVVLPEVADTSVIVGARGGSLWLFTSNVTDIVSEPPSPSSTATVNP